MILNANSAHIPMADGSVHMAVTSPPYYGLRSYLNNDNPLKDQEIGLESTPEEYIEKIVRVFREVKRVLRDDGTAWLNLGDSYSSGIGSNINNLLAERIKEGIILNGRGCALTITTKSDCVLKDNQFPPEFIFTSFFGVKSITVKNGDDDFCQILDSFTPIHNCRVSSRIIATVDYTNAELVLDSDDGICIIVSGHNLDSDPPVVIPITANTRENSETSLSVKETGKPVSKSVCDIQSIWDSVSFNSLLKCCSQVNIINDSVPFTDAFMARTKLMCDLSITKSSTEHLAFLMMDGQIKFTFRSVAHLFISNLYGSLIHYTELYHQTEQTASERKAKQELGIPEMVKRALMRDGWICRQTIIWHKPNPMPESVTDR